MIEKAIGWFGRRRFRKHPLLDELYPIIERLPKQFQQTDPLVYVYWSDPQFEQKRIRFLQILFELLVRITEDKVNDLQLLEVYRNLIADNLGEFSKYYPFFLSKNDSFEGKGLQHPCIYGLAEYQEELLSQYWHEEYRKLGSIEETTLQCLAWMAEAYSSMIIGSAACKILGDNVEEWFQHYVEAACGMREFQFRAELEIDNFTTDVGIAALSEFKAIHENVCKGYRHPLEDVNLLDHSAEPKLDRIESN